MKGSINIRTVLLLLLIHFFLVAKSQIEDVSNTSPAFSIGSEYYVPTWDNRALKTINLNAIYYWPHFKKIPISLAAGITFSHAWGMQQDFDEYYSEIFSNNNVIGIGPLFIVGYELIFLNNFSLVPEFSGAFILYSKKFPKGGDIYNFMWRMGGSLSYKFKNGHYGISVPFRWMHVSNGKGLTSKNPSYEGVGIGLNFVKYLK